MPLTPKQLEEVRTAIDKRRAALVEEIRADMARVRADTVASLGGEVRDSADEAVAGLLADTGNAETTRDVDELRALDDAALRLKAGHYGTCQACGGDIPYERLAANPAAIRCFNCQSRHERTHYHPDEPRL